MTRLDAYLIYQINYKPALTHPLHHTLFTDAQCNIIQSSIINAILPKMGYNRHMPRAVIFGPTTYGGSGLADAKVEQAVHLIMDMITDIQRSTLVGKQFVFLIANYQRYLGTSIPFFSQNPDDFPYKPANSRITLIWKKMYSHNISIKAPPNGGPQSLPWPMILPSWTRSSQGKKGSEDLPLQSATPCCAMQTQSVSTSDARSSAKFLDRGAGWALPPRKS